MIIAIILKTGVKRYMALFLTEGGVSRRLHARGRHLDVFCGKEEGKNGKI